MRNEVLKTRRSFEACFEGHEMSVKWVGLAKYTAVSFSHANVVML